MTRLQISKRLQEWHHQAERILALFDVGGQSVQAQDQQKAKVLLINLKDELEAEHKRLSPKAEERLSPDEVAITNKPGMKVSLHSASSEGTPLLMQRGLVPSTTC